MKMCEELLEESKSMKQQLEEAKQKKAERKAERERTQGNRTPSPAPQRRSRIHTDEHLEGHSQLVPVDLVPADMPGPVGVPAPTNAEPWPEDALAGLMHGGFLPGERPNPFVLPNARGMAVARAPWGHAMKPVSPMHPPWSRGGLNLQQPWGPNRGFLASPPSPRKPVYDGTPGRIPIRGALQQQSAMLQELFPQRAKLGLHA